MLIFFIDCYIRWRGIQKYGWWIQQIKRNTSRNVGHDGKNDSLNKQEIKNVKKNANWTMKCNVFSNVCYFCATLLLWEMKDANAYIKIYLYFKYNLYTITCYNQILFKNILVIITCNNFSLQKNTTFSLFKTETRIDTKIQ